MAELPLLLTTFSMKSCKITERGTQSQFTPTLNGKGKAYATCAYVLLWLSDVIAVTPLSGSCSTRERGLQI